MSKYAVCDYKVPSCKPGLTCAGSCQHVHHPDCLKIPADFVNLLTSIPGLFYKCQQCIELENRDNNIAALIGSVRTDLLSQM